MIIAAITWATRDNWWYIIPLIISIGFLSYRAWCTKKVVRLLGNEKWFPLLLPGYSWWRTVIKVICSSVAGFSLYCAILSPQWGTNEERIEQEGRDLLIALDISRSMLAQDCKPDRLTCAKNKIKELLKQLSCERIGLILFSGSTFVQCPLTQDYRAFLLFLDQIDVETISSGTTSLDQAIRQALSVFERNPSRKNKLLLLLTDGEDFSSNLAGIKQQAIQAELHIFALGIGTLEGAPVPLYDGLGNPLGHQKDKQGKVVISRLNEGILHALTHDCSRTYLRVASDNQDINTLVSVVQKFEKERIEDKQISRLIERYPYFVALSYGALLIEWLL